jgi:hypothetical protein
LLWQAGAAPALTPVSALWASFARFGGLKAAPPGRSLWQAEAGPALTLASALWASFARFGGLKPAPPGRLLWQADAGPALTLVSALWASFARFGGLKPAPPGRLKPGLPGRLLRQAATSKSMWVLVRQAEAQCQLVFAKLGSA